jgi:hypothetical protein
MAIFISPLFTTIQINAFLKLEKGKDYGHGST